MKNTVKILSVAILALFINSCTNDDRVDDPKKIDNPNDKGAIQLHFDPTFDKTKLKFDQYNNYKNLEENLKISRFSYIISNIRLKTAEGKEIILPKEDGYYIIDSAKKQLNIELKDIPVGKYKEVILGIGIDKKKYEEGQTKQQKFWDLAAEHHMTWSWTTGYKFVNFEGQYKVGSNTKEKNFKIHLGSHGKEVDFYREVTINYPKEDFVVRKDTKTSAHLFVDAKKILTGKHLITFEKDGGTIMLNKEMDAKIADNCQKMFEIDHVHIGGHGH